MLVFQYTLSIIIKFWWNHLEIPYFTYNAFFSYTPSYTPFFPFSEPIVCDGILRVDMFHYFLYPYIICTFFAKFIYNEYIRPHFLSHIVSTLFASDPPKGPGPKGERSTSQGP
jgi:hypothetical protein